jgi:hypothetical protein
MYVMWIGLEHLQSGIRFSTTAPISFHPDGPTSFKVYSTSPFGTDWPQEGRTLHLDSYEDTQSWRPEPESDAMIRARVERNNVLQQAASDRELRNRLEEIQANGR